MEHDLATVLTDFELCVRCGELRGPFAWDDGRARRRLVQECRCQRDLRAEAPARWWGFDFNVAAELCPVCGAGVVPSGTRFATSVCGACRAGGLRLKRDDRLNEWSREALCRNLDASGLSHRSIVPLADYLEVVGRVDRQRRVDECITYLDHGAAID